MGDGLRLTQTQIYAISGFTSGLLQAAIFNPWDRALYLSVKSHTNFLSLSNFSRPYQGFSQSIFSRVLSGGSYFPLVDIFEPLFANKFNLQRESAANKALAGHAAGAINGICINFLTAIKYETWGQAEANKMVGQRAPGMLTTALQMYQSARRGNYRREHRKAGYFRRAHREANRGKIPGFFSWEQPRHPFRLWLSGSRPFTKGIVATVIRDAVFGGAFALIKLHTRPVPPPPGQYTAYYRLLDNASILLAGATATIASAPWNYARNIKYATPPDLAAPSTWVCLRDLFRDARTAKIGTLRFLQQRLRIGWGTARVACGMAVGFQLYEHTKAILEKATVEPQLHFYSC